MSAFWIAYAVVAVVLCAALIYLNARRGWLTGDDAGVAAAFVVAYCIGWPLLLGLAIAAAPFYGLHRLGTWQRKRLAERAVVAPRAPEGERL